MVIGRERDGGAMPPEYADAGMDRVTVITNDPERATEAFRHGFPGIHLQAVTDGPAFRFEWQRVSDGRITANRLRLTGSAEGRGSIREAIAVGRVRGGRLALEYGREVVDTARPYLRPAGRSVAHLEDARLELIELDPAAFSAAARRYLEGTGRVLLPPSPRTAAPSTGALVATWEQVSAHVVDAAFDEAAWASPLIRSGLFDLVVASLLATFPLTTEVRAPGPDGVRPSSIRRAVAYIEDHVAEPLDVVAIADAARVSVRGLQAGFQRHLGVTPMQHLRLRRLAAARQDLLDADPAEVTVATVARRWGFAHLSRFARLYRATYGENPSQTLYGSHGG
jgi:AraC-like DNA-binding protein